MVQLNSRIALLREIANACSCRAPDGRSTAAATTSLTAGISPWKTARTNASNRTWEGDELDLEPAETSTTVATTALTATSTSITIASGTGFPTGGTNPFYIGIDQEIILVTRSSVTLTVIGGIMGRGCFETRPAAHIVGATVYCSPINPNPQGIAAFVASTGVFTPDAAWDTDPGEVLPFSIYTRGVSKWEVVRALNGALRELKDDSYYPLSLVTDGDMRNAGTVDWATGGSPTISKVTNTNAIRGPQALRVLATVAADYAQSASLLVNPDFAPSWYVWAMVRADVGSATLRAYDVTNSASIATDTWTDRGWGMMSLPFALPSTCQAVAFRLISDTSTSDVYWNTMGAHPTGGHELALPSWIDRPGYIWDVVSDRGSTDRYDNPLWRPEPGRLIHDPSNPNTPYRYQFDSQLGPRPYYLHVVRPYDALAADTQTTYADRDLVVAAAAVKLCEIQLNKPSSEHTPFWKLALRDRRREYAELSWNVLPAPELVPGYERAW